MGTGASSSPASTPEPPASNRPSTQSHHLTTRYTDHHKPLAATKAMDVDDQKSCMVRTNEVAPIIIKNCKEEFQHVSEFKEPIVYGCIAEGMPEHALVQNKYFLVHDVADRAMDTLGTFPEYLAPNLRKVKGGYPVWALGQPTKDGLNNFILSLREESYKYILLFNLREEPVIFVPDGFDMVPYSPRHQDSLHECVFSHRRSIKPSTADMEVEMRREIIDLAAFKDDQRFYFYNNITTFENEPHLVRMAYEDDLGVSEEIYSRFSFNNSGLSYLRLGLGADGVPQEAEIEAFLDLFRNIPNFFDKKRDRGSLAVAFTSHSGRMRATLGSVMGTLVMAHKQGFPQEARQTPYQMNEKSPNFERGEFAAVRHLVHLLPHGQLIKHETDVIIDLCADVINLKTTIADAKKNLESITEDYIIEGKSAKEFFLSRCMKDLERYCYLICFNAYLHDEFKSLFGKSFTHWMQENPDIYTIFRTLNVSEHKANNSDLLARGERVLVADDYLGLDVLSSQMDVKTSNFRRVPGFPVYGMAQPSREGLSCVVNHLLSKKQGHPLVVLFNMREDVVVECNGSTYSVREKAMLEEPLTMAAVSASEIQEKEEQLKKDIKSKKTFEVYQEVDQAPETREFNSVLTCVDMWEQLRLQTKDVGYHRIPIWDDAAPNEKHFDQIMQVIMGLDGLHTDEDGPALVFHCRTGKGRTTTCMAIAGLIIAHQKGFPYGTKPGEEERVSLPNAKYTQGHYKIVQEVVRRIPNGQQVKREVDFILNQCSDTMTPMHYHVREVIFVTFNKMKKAKTAEEREYYKKRSLDYLERYIYLILFNTYLHCERRCKWATPFSQWMKEIAAKAGMYQILDNLAFLDFDSAACPLKSRHTRWTFPTCNLPVRGPFV